MMKVEQEKIKRSLRYSLWDGMFASVMNGCTETFIAPYALALKASTGMIGILSSVPNLIAAIVQIKSAALVEWLGSRKAVINITVYIHAIMWIPMIAIPYVCETSQALYLIVFYTLFISIGAIASAPWSSLMADHVPETERGRVFGNRNRIFGTISMLSMFGAGTLLSAFKSTSLERSGVVSSQNIIFGFSVVFTVAFICRLMSWRFLTMMYEPKLVIGHEHRFTIVDFLRRIRKSNFGRFAIFVSTFNFSISMAGPFFAVYMLKDLGFSYATYTAIVMTAAITNLFAMGMWGWHADHVGNRRILRLTTSIIPIIPILWIFSHNIVYLIGIQIIAGFLFAGFTISFSNFIYDAVRPEKRTRCIAYFSVLNGIGVFAGAILGGYLVNILPPIFGPRLLTLFFLSGVFRFLATFLCKNIKEVRKVKEVSNSELFYSIIGLKKIIPSMQSAISESN